MKKTLNNLLLTACLIFSQKARAQENNNSSQENVSYNQAVDYKSLVSSGKIHPDIYGLTVTLMAIDSMNYDEFDEIIKYFISHGCNINQSIIVSELEKYILKVYKFYKNEEIDENLIEEEIMKEKSFFLRSIFFLLRYNLFTLAASAKNIYLLKALLNNGISVNNTGGIAAFLIYTNEYDFIDSASPFKVCCSQEYSDTVLDIIKKIYAKSSFLTRSCLSTYAYLATSKNSYNAIVNN